MSTPSEVRVTVARGREDIGAASQVMLRCFAGRENANLGPLYTRAVMRSFAMESSRSLHVAWVGDRLAGFASGEPTGARAARYRTLRPVVAAALLLRPWLLLNAAIRRMAIHRFAIDSEDPSPTESWFLGIIGVDPDFQGRGVGRQLLHAFEDEGGRRGFAEASLVVLESNLPARALYEHAGWHISGRPANGRVCYEKSLDSSKNPRRT